MIWWRALWPSPFHAGYIFISKMQSWNYLSPLVRVCFVCKRNYITYPKSYIFLSHLQQKSDKSTVIIRHTKNAPLPQAFSFKAFLRHSSENLWNRSEWGGWFLFEIIKNCSFAVFIALSFLISIFWHTRSPGSTKYTSEIENNPFYAWIQNSQIENVICILLKMSIFGNNH